MIDIEDVVTVEVTYDEVENCKRNPAPGCTRLGTGQLKAVGNLVVQKVFGVAMDAEYKGMAADEFIKTTGVALACRLKDGRVAGIASTVSMIRDSRVLDKRVIVPANQLYKHPDLDAHYTVAVYVLGQTDENKELVSVDKVWVAGWVLTSKLRKNVEKGGTGPFRVQNASLAIAPSNILDGINHLTSMVHWKKFRV